MKYFKTTYEVNKPIDLVFEKVLDVADLQMNIGLFDKAHFTTNEYAPNELGKAYSVVNYRGDIAIRCIITLVKLDKPNYCEFSYTYELKNENGDVKNGCQFLPWESMSCLVKFEDRGGSTVVTTRMDANGIKSTFGKIYTKVAVLYNKYQQLKHNRSISRYVENQN